ESSKMLRSPSVAVGDVVCVHERGARLPRMPIGPRSRGYTTSMIVARLRRSKMPRDPVSASEGSLRGAGVDGAWRFNQSPRTPHVTQLRRLPLEFQPLARDRAPVLS